MRIKERYDVICAGGSLSSYLCGALLARAGRKVLVVEDPDRAMARTYGAGYVFDPDFTGFVGLSETGVFGRSIRELGIEDEMFVGSSAELQVITPGYRIDFSPDNELLRRSLRREIRAGADQISDFFGLLCRASTEVPSFLDDVVTRGKGSASDLSAWKRFWGPYYGFMQSERPVALGEVLPESIAAECESLGSAILGATSYVAPYNLGCEQSLRGLSLSLRPQSHCVGGLEALKRRLGGIISGAGGAVKAETRVESLIVESSRVAGVLLFSFEGIVRADTVILGSQLRRLYGTLPEGMQDPTLLRAIGRVQPSSWRYTISVTVNREVIPLGATEFMTYVGSSQSPLEEENYLRIRIVPDALKRRNPGDERDTATLLVTALAPYRASTLDYAYLRRLGGKMLRVLAELMPFLEQNIVAIYPDFRVSDRELRETYPFSGPEWVPENLIHYYVRGQRRAQDFAGPSWTSAHEGLYFAGRAIWPSLGVYGEALVARRIFDDVMSPRH